MNSTNILGTVASAVAFTLALLTNVLGCSTNAAGVSECSASFLSPETAGYVTMAFTAVLLLSKMLRDGGPLRGLFGTTAVVVPATESGPGVVTSAQVSSG